MRARPRKPASFASPAEARVHSEYFSGPEAAARGGEWGSPDAIFAASLGISFPLSRVLSAGAR